MKPKVAVDREACVGAGMCALTAPVVFDQDPEDGRVVLLEPTPPPERYAVVRQAAEVCPSGAVTVVEHRPPSTP